MFDRFLATLSAIGTLLIVLIMALICLDVFSRNLTGHPVIGVPELVALSIVAIVFLQGPHALACGRWTSSELVLQRLRRWPRMCAALEAAFHLVGAALFAILFTQAVPLAVAAARNSEFIGAEGIFTFPTWPLKWIVVLGSATICLQFLRVVMQRLASLRGRTEIAA